MRRLQPAIGAALLAAAMAVAGCGLGSSSARSTTESFFGALSEGKGREACSSVAPGRARVQVLSALAEGESEKSAAAQGSCESFARSLSPKRKTLLGTAIVDPAPGSGGKTVTVRLQDEEKNPTVPYSVRLNKRDDDWKLVSVNSGGAP